MPFRGASAEQAKKNDDFSARERLADLEAFGRSVFWFQVLMMTAGLGAVVWAGWAVGSPSVGGGGGAVAANPRHDMAAERLFLRFVVAPVYALAYVITVIFRREWKVTTFTLLFSCGVACYALGFVTLLAFKEAVANHAL